MRIKNSFNNLAAAWGGQALITIIQFVSRMVFVRILSAEYLGVNGLFSNVISMLSLAELGIGNAIIYSLYKPIAANDIDKICSLMDLYKKAYILIGLFIAVVGITLTPFLSFFVKEIPNIQYIRLIYIIFVINASITYFFSYKAALINASQKSYITSLNHYKYSILSQIIQIFILIFTHNYVLYLVCMLVSTVLQNVTISYKADKMYPFLKVKNPQKLNKNAIMEIKKNVIGLTMHKFGGIVVSATDNLVIARFIGVIYVGIYSNYLLITNALLSITNNIFSSIVASIGNMAVIDNEKKQYEVFNTILFLGFWIYGFCSISLLCLFNPFIKLMFGEKYLFDFNIVFIIIINFFLTGIRRPVLSFRDAMGLYWYDRYKALAEAVLNLIISITLVIKIGFVGVIIGTIVSTLLTCFWVEPFILYKKAFGISVWKYFYKIAIYILIITVSGLLTFLCCYYIYDNSVNYFIYKIIICLIIPNGLWILIYYRKREFQYLLLSLKSLLRNRK